jgi:hypothetical protein
VADTTQPDTVPPLLPCPHCGAKMEMRWHVSEQSGAYWTVECSNRYAHMHAKSASQAAAWCNQRLYYVANVPPSRTIRLPFLEVPRGGVARSARPSPGDSRWLTR